MNISEELFNLFRKKPDGLAKTGKSYEWGVRELARRMPEVSKAATLLCPGLAQEPLPLEDSKFGGMGWTTPLTNCKACGSQTRLVLQLRRNEFPDMFFPEGKDIFIVSRCPNKRCDGLKIEGEELAMSFGYFNTVDLTVSTASEDNSAQLNPECKLYPVVVPDYPNYDEEISISREIEDQVVKEEQDNLSDYFCDEYSARFGSKLGGFPAFTQYPFYPRCQTCGQQASFLLQIASQEAISANEVSTYQTGWSDHGIMIGDLGNLYLYVCRSCANEKVYSYWDCY